MREMQGDLFAFSPIVIPTNGCVNRWGQCVMGRGCAKEARDRFPGLARNLGAYIRRYGNRVFDLGTWEGTHILSFPVCNRQACKARVVAERRPQAYPMQRRAACRAR